MIFSSQLSPEIFLVFIATFPQSISKNFSLELSPEIFIATFPGADLNFSPQLLLDALVDYYSPKFR